MTTWKLEHNDVIEWAREYQGERFHAMLCDPPYHLTSVVKRFGKGEPEHTKTYADIKNRSTPIGRLAAGFMNQTWDGGGIAFDPATWAALAQHLYPGAFIMAFAGSRGYHRMACAMEDAGLIIHPAMGWLTLSGFPKATRIDTQIDKAAGAKGDVEWYDKYHDGRTRTQQIEGKGSIAASKKRAANTNFRTTPATPLARDWAGHRYGLQSLKPAFEFIALAQVPYEGRPVDSIVSSGAGALWIDGGRIGTRESNESGWSKSGSKASVNRAMSGPNYERGPKDEIGLGRWPSNFLLQCGCDPNRNDPAHQEKCPVRLFDEQAGESVSGGPAKERSATDNFWSGKSPQANDPETYNGGDSGPASRMFYQASWQYEVAEQLANAEPVRYEPKVSSSERDAGLDDLETITRHRVNAGGLENEPRFAPTQVKNNHPCLKPISLTKYLATLLLPPMAYAPRRILIPFLGSGSEAAGAILAGWEEVIGIESNAAYVEIARARLAWWSQWPGWGQTDVDAILAAAKDKEDDRQLSLFDAA